MSRFHLFLLAILAAVAVAWLATGEQSEEEAETPLAIEDDYYLDDFEMEVFDHDGRMTHRVSGRNLRQLSTSHDFEMAAPRFVLSSDAGHWNIDARSGWMDAAMTQAKLRGQISAVGQTADDRLLLTTSDLDIDLAGKRASTDALVSITQGDNRLRGEALTANLQTHRLRLRHNIEGYYVP